MDTEEKGIKDVMKSQSSDPDSDPYMDEMVRLARRHYATGFPNPQRRGCPPPGEIVKVAGRGRAPDQSLLAHLFECSECFGEYRKALAQYRDEFTVWQRLVSIFTLRRVSAAAVILLSLFFGGRLILRQFAPDARNVQVAHSTASDARGGETALNQSAAPALAGITPLPPTSRTAGEASPSSILPKPDTVSIDLDNYLVFRESQDEKPPGTPGLPGMKNERAAEEKAIALPAARVRLVLRLPETGVAGDYTVSLVDAFDHVLSSSRAVSQDGAKLQVALDLRRISPEKYRLRLSREAEAPAYYDVIIMK